MKRNLTFIALLVCAITSAQNISDILRYSNENIQGTARFQSMGGAFGALGGDISALNINPAGAAVFNHNSFTFSGTLYNRDNLTSYGGNSISNINSYIDVNQAGGALVFKTTNPESQWGKFVIAANYDVIENFDNTIFADGASSEGIDNYFLDFAQGVPFGDILD